MASEKKSATDLEVEQASTTIGHVSVLRPGELTTTSTVRRNIGPFTIIALGFNICNSWVGIGSSLAISVAAGGTVTVIYGVVVTSFVYACIAISLAELASAYPTAGGQYHFTFLIAPEKLKRGLSYVCGATAIFSWIAITAAATILSAEALLAIPVFFLGHYNPPAWHYFLVYQGINLLFLLYNMLALKRMPWIHDAACKHHRPLPKGPLLTTRSTSCIQHNVLHHYHCDLSCTRAQGIVVFRVAGFRK